MNILNFPPDFLAGLVFSWIDTRAILHLDSAFCCKINRPTFLEFLSFEHSVVRNLPTVYTTVESNSAFTWAAMRMVRSQSLLIRFNIDLDVLENYLRVIRSVVHIEAHQQTDIVRFNHLIDTYCRQISGIFYWDCAISSSLGGICTSCTRLTEVMLHECRLSADALVGISLPSLQTLSIMACGCDDQCMIAAVSWSSQIVNLSIGGNELSDQAVRDTITKMPQLQKLSLFQLPVSDETIDAITAACSALIAIDVVQCVYLTDAAIGAIVFNCKCLQDLLMFFNPSYTREAMLMIAHHCPGLKRLCADKFVDATCEDEILLLTSCRHLECVKIHISVPQCIQYLPSTVVNMNVNASFATDEMLGAVGKHCKGLTQLIITENQEPERLYTAVGLAAIARGCRQLRKLVLCGSAEQVSELTLLVWRILCPNLVLSDTMGLWEYELFAPASINY